LKNLKINVALEAMKKDRLLKGMLTIATGSVGAKLIALLALPIITRLYNSSEFGELSIFSAIALVTAPLLSLRYVNAIAVPKGRLVALNLLVLSITIIMIFGIVMSLIVYVLGKHVGELFSFAIAEYWWLLLLTVIGVGLYESMTLWATRYQCYKVMAVTQFQQSFFGSVAKIALGYMGCSTFGLLVGQWIQNSAGLMSYCKILGPGIAKDLKYVSLKRVCACAIKYADFPRYRLPSHVLMLAGIHAPVLFFGYKYNSEVTGQLALAIMVLSLPTQVIGTAMSHAFLGEITKQNYLQGGDLKQSVMSVIKTMVIISVVPAALLISFGEEIFKFAFGHEWVLAGVYAQILSSYLVAKFVSTPLMHVFTVKRKQKMFLKLNSVRFIMLLLVGWASIGLSLEPYLTLALFSCVMTVHYLYSTYVVFWIIKS